MSKLRTILFVDHGRGCRRWGLFLMLALAFDVRASELADLENRVFGRPDWRPPVSWQLPEVCQRDFWTILHFPSTDIVDPYAKFQTGDEWTRFSMFKECGAQCFCNADKYDRPAPAYAIGERYATGWIFVPKDKWPPVFPFWEARRKTGIECGLPEFAIDGNLQTDWGYRKILPQWICCELADESEIDGVRFYPYHPDKPVYKFYMEVSPDGKNWTTVADRRENDQPVTNAAGVAVAFVPVKTRYVRLTITGLDSLNSNLYEIEALCRGKKIPFVKATASSSYYEDAYLPRSHFEECMTSLSNAFLGYCTQEWGNDLGHLERFWEGHIETYTNEHGVGASIADWQKYFPAKPKTRAAYLEFLRNECSRLIQRSGGKWFELESAPFSLLTPYTLEWGATTAAQEFHLAGPNNYSVGMDILRGAARQYGLPMYVYLTTYNGGDGSRTSPRWSNKQAIPAGYTKPWEDDNPHNGVSLEFQKRWLWFVYLSGANLVDFAESAYFYDRSADHVQTLSPYGRLQLEWYEEVKKHPDRGIRATPVAFGFDYAYGAAAHFSPDGKKGFEGYDEEEVKALYSLVHAGIYNNITRGEQVDYRFIAVDEQRASRYRPENGALRNREYGEAFDWIMLNAPSGAGEKALTNYRVLYLLGRVDPTPQLAKVLTAHFQAGGIVVAHLPHIACIPEEFRAIKLLKTIEDSEDIHDELTGREHVMAPYQGPVLKDNVKGKYSLALVDAKNTRTIYSDRVNRPVVLWSKAGQGGIFWVLAELHGHNFLPLETDLLKRLADNALPFRIRGDIQSVINKTKDGWVVGLFNNKGVYKLDPYKEADVDPGEASPVEVLFSGRKLRSVSEWLTGEKIRPEKDSAGYKISLTVPAGDLRILQLRE